MKVSAGPYTLEIPPNGVALLYGEDGKQLPGGVGYLDALVQFAGEVIRLNSMIATIRDAALEEAAQACVGSGAIVAEARLCASAIRALKEQAR